MIGLSLFHGNEREGINYEDGNDEEGNNDLFRNVSDEFAHLLAKQSVPFFLSENI